MSEAASVPNTTQTYQAHQCCITPSTLDVHMNGEEETLAENDLSSCTALLTAPAGLRGPNQNSACTVSLKLIFPCRHDGIWINPSCSTGREIYKGNK